MRLGAAVCLLPMHHPLQVAEDFAMLDLLSNGRLNFGAGRGMHPLEYATFNADWGTAQLRLPKPSISSCAPGRVVSSNGTASTTATPSLTSIPNRIRSLTRRFTSRLTVILKASS